jgi:hypothetical protein
LSASIGELWPDINKLDTATQEGASAQSYQGNSPLRPSSGWSNRGMEGGAMHATRLTSLDDAPGPTSALPNGYGGGSARSKAARILSGAPRAVSPRMRRSSVDR